MSAHSLLDKACCCYCSVTQSCPTLRRQASQTSPSLRVFPSSCLHWWCHPAISSSDALFSFCPQSFPASGTFPMSHLFASDDQNTEASASASVLPMSNQGWSPLRWTGWISLQSKGLSGVFSSTTVKSINSLAVSFLHSPTLTSIHDQWKNHSFDETDLWWQSNVSAFKYAV